MKLRKKLIEVALPLEAINIASAREKSIRHGHPSTLHLWWARRPLAAARAVIFAQMVDDPSANPDLFPTEKAQEKERQRLFKIIEELVQWENTTNERVLQAAAAVARQTGAIHQRAVVAAVARRVSAPEEAVLGTTPVGARLLLRDGGREDDHGAHRESKVGRGRSGVQDHRAHGALSRLAAGSASGGFSRTKTHRL